MDHVIECVLSKIELFGLYELFFELVDVSNQTNASALVEVARFVDPEAWGWVVDELDLVGHHVQTIGFGKEVGRRGRHEFALLCEF